MGYVSPLGQWHSPCDPSSGKLRPPQCAALQVSGSSIVGNGRCATEQCKPICVIDDTLSKTSSPAQQHASHSHRSSRLGAGGACVQFNARARSTATRGSPSRPACTAHQVRSARPHSLGGIQSRPLLAFFSLRPAAPPSASAA